MAVLIGGAVWWWRFKVLHEAGSEVADFVGRVRGRQRMRSFKKKAEGSVLANITDPALAAAVFLFALAAEKPGALHATEPEIRARIGAIVPPAELDELLSYAQWAARDISDPRDIVRRFKSLWREKLTREERAELVAMAEAVMEKSGSEPDHNQQVSFSALRASLAPEQTR